MFIDDYADGEYPDSEDANALSVHAGDNDYAALCHPIKNHAHVDDAHHEYGCVRDQVVRVYAHACDARQDATICQFPLMLLQSKIIWTLFHEKTKWQWQHL